MGCPRLTYQLKTVYRAGVAGVTREEKVSRENLKRGVDTGNYYYGARYYDPKVSVWLSVDPLSSKSPHLTPYHFVSNNPVMRVDPDGLHDYTVDQDGNIALAKETNDKFDMLYATDDYAQDRKNGLKVDHVDGESVFTITQNKTSEGGRTSSFNIDDDQTAIDVYHFLGNNSKVEWSRTKYDWNDGYGSGNMIATSHLEDREDFASDFINKLNDAGGSAVFFSHSHPGDNMLNFHGPSGEHPLDLTEGGGDLSAARDFSKMFPNLKYSIYDVSLGKEIPYDQYGSGWWTKSLKKPAVKIR